MSDLSSARLERLAALRADVRAVEVAGRRQQHPGLPFGVEAIDSRLADGGLATALHEIAGDCADSGEDAAATLFIAGIAARLAAMRPGASVIWALARRDLFAPGLAQAGLAPDRLIYAECGGDADVLAVMEEALRYGGLAAVVGEAARAAMATTRRLQLAAEEGGTMALMLRRWRRGGADPLAEPSAAMTRWRVGCAPSSPMPMEGIGRARWRLALARQRGGDPFNLIVEASDAEGRIALPAELADRPAVAAGSEKRRAA